MSFKRQYQASICADNRTFCQWAAKQLLQHDETIRRNLYEALVRPAPKLGTFPDIGVSSFHTQQDECFGYVRIKLPPPNTPPKSIESLLSAFLGGGLRETVTFLQRRPFGFRTREMLAMHNSHVNLLVRLALRWQKRCENPYLQPPTIEQEELFERRDISAFQRVLEIHAAPIH